MRVETAGFVVSYPVVSVTTDAAFSLVVDPLDFDAAAEKFAVLVIGFCGKAEAPHGVPCRRFHHSAMSTDQLLTV